MLKKTSFLILILTSCVIDKTPEELFLGNYCAGNGECLNILNDSVIIHSYYMDDFLVEDTLSFVYHLPLSPNIVKVSTGDIRLKNKKINSNSMLYKFCLEHELSDNYFIYTIRYGKYMILPNPESTEFAFVLDAERNR